MEIARQARGTTFLERTVNGQPGLIAQQNGVTVTVFAFQFAGERIKHIWAVRNPESSARGRRPELRVRGQPCRTRLKARR